MEEMQHSGLIEALALFSVLLMSSSVFALLFSRAVGEQRGGGEQSRQPAVLLTGAVWQSGTQFFKSSYWYIWKLKIRAPEMTSCLSKFYSCQGRNVSETGFISPWDTPLEKIVMKLSLGALRRRVRPEFLSRVSLRRYKILPHPHWNNFSGQLFENK